MMAPLTSFLSEEAYQYFPGKTQDSIFMESYPNANTEWFNAPLGLEFEDLFSIRDEVSKQLEEARRNKTIGSSLEASVEIEAPERPLQLLNKYSQHLREFFIVSQLSCTLGHSLKVSVTPAKGDKCPRCWNYDNLVTLGEYGEICNKCVEALK